MIWVLAATGWLVCAVVAYRMLVWWWTANLDLTRAEAVLLAVVVMVFGPVSIFIALSVIGLGRLDGSPSPIVKARRGR